MNVFGRMKNAWGALWQDPQGFVPVASGGGASTPRSSGGDEVWMHIAAYFACIRNLSEDVAKLPFLVYTRLPRGKDRNAAHPYSRLLRKQAHPAVGAFAFRETMTRFALGWGNGFAEILRRNSGEAYALEIIHPQYVTTQAGENGAVAYAVKVPGADAKTIPSKNMIHIHGLSSDGVNGLSVAGFARETLMFAEGAQTYGANLFNRGGRPGGIITHPGKLDPKAKENLKTSWEAAYGGKNAGRTAVLDHGVDYKAITINPVDAQYLETRQFTVEEIARWFRMPLHKIQFYLRAQGWSTLDAMNTDYLTDTLMPWLVRWEEEVNRKLFAEDETHFAEHLVVGMLRGDQKSRAEFYMKMFSIGALSINEMREAENMNPIPGDAGDKHFVPMNMTPAEFVSSVGGGKANDDA